MVRKSATEFTQPWWPSDYTPFCEAGVREILENGKIRTPRLDLDDLKEACLLLNYGAQRLRYHEEMAKQPTEAEYAKFVEQLQKHIAALQALLPLIDEDGLRPRVIEGVSHLFINQMVLLLPKHKWTTKLDAGMLMAGPDDILLFFVRSLRLLSDSLIETVAAYDVPRQVREAPPMQHFASIAALAYLDLADLDWLSVSRSPETKKVGGPLIRFVEACCERIDEEIPRERLALWIRTWRGRWKGKRGLFNEGEDPYDVDPEELEDE